MSTAGVLARETVTVVVAAKFFVMSGWLLCDYGGVLSTAPPPGEWAELAAAASVDDIDRFHQVFWEHRPAYDRGDIVAFEYWTHVTGAAPDPSRLDDLVRRDVKIWLHRAPGSAEAAMGTAESAGLRLALLSNAPVEVAAAIDGLDWLRPWEPRFFSCRLRRVKPEPEAYLDVLRELSAEPGEVWFFDDRERNVAAAAALGINAVLFTNPEDFSRPLAG